MSYCFIAILVEICIKCVIFIEKLQKNRLELGVSPPDPLAFGGLGLRPKTSNLPFRIPGYATAPHHSFNTEYQAGKL